jgi:hypothetical protein
VCIGRSPFEIPRANLCVYGPLKDRKLIQPPLDPDTSICTTDARRRLVAAASLTDSAQRECLDSYIEFLCRPVSREQTFDTFPVLARVMELDNNDFATGFNTVLTKCYSAHGGGESGREWIRQNVRYGLCRDNAELIRRDQIVRTLDGDTASPGATSSPLCHYYPGTR